MSFQILDKEDKPIGINQLDREAAKFWNQSVDPKWYAHPPNTSLNWFDSIGYMIHRPMSDYTSGWKNIKCSLWTVQIQGAFEHINQPEVMNESIHHSIQFLKPYFQLIDHWQSKGYQPKQVE